MAIQQLIAAYSGAPASPVGQKWNTGYFSLPALFDAGDLQLLATTADGPYGNSRGLLACNGLCYFSAKLSSNAAGSVCGVGVADATSPLTNQANYPGFDNLGASLGSPDGEIYKNNASIGSAGGITPPVQVEIAVNTPTRECWFRFGGGSWIGGGNPATGTSPTCTLSGSGAIYPAAWVATGFGAITRYVEINPTAGTTTGAVPSGFTAASWI